MAAFLVFVIVPLIQLLGMPTRSLPNIFRISIKNPTISDDTAMSRITMAVCVQGNGRVFLSSSFPSEKIVLTG